MTIELESLQLTEQLRERVKELSFLHHAARLLNMRGETRDIVRALAELLPSAWRYPERAAARISFEGVDIATRDYLPSGAAMRTDFELDAARRGFIEVCYPDANTAEAAQLFLPEEQALLDSCAELLKSYFERVSGEAISKRLFHAEAAEQAARSDNRAKDQFMGTVAHELRSSLHVMLGWIQILKQGPLQGEMASRGLQILERNVTLQAKLIEDLMDLSRIVSGKLKLELKPLDLSELVGFAVDATRPAAEKKQLQLTADLQRVGEVLADQQRLQQVVYNLLGNAVKFTPAGGRIHVTVARLGKLARVIVKDSGIGIPPGLLPHIFERYRQAETESKGRSGGLGLGLAIAHQIVELHQGTISAACDGPGAGTMFQIVLPLRADAQYTQ
jgi:signal transduction histidine kinase